VREWGRAKVRELRVLKERLLGGPSSVFGWHDAAALAEAAVAAAVAEEEAAAAVAAAAAAAAGEVEEEEAEAVAAAVEGADADAEAEAVAVAVAVATASKGAAAASPGLPPELHGMNLPGFAASTYSALGTCGDGDKRKSSGGDGDGDDKKEAKRAGHTLVHFSAQLEACLTHEHTLHTLNIPSEYGLYNPYAHPLSPTKH